MPVYIVVDSQTGEFHEDCSHCGFREISGSGIDDRDVEIFESASLSEGHIMVEITNDERELLNEREIVLEEIGVKGGAYVVDAVPGERKYRLDMPKATSKIHEREKVEVPIEAEGIGGKEIIAMEERPVGVIVDKGISQQDSK